MDDADLDLLLALANEGEEYSEPRKQDAPNSGRRAGHPLSASRTPIPQRTGTIGADPVRSRGDPQFTSTTKNFAALSAPAQSTPRIQQPNRQIFDGYLDSVSGFRVSKPVIGSLVLKERLTDDGVYISLKDISPSRELSGRWATMGVLTSKVQATGRDGSPYSRWTLSDLAGKQVTLFLWRKAASEHYKELEGSLLLLWSPQVRRDEGGSSGGGAGYSLNIDKPEMLQRPGMSADFGLCRGIRKDGQRCTLPINKSTCEYCPYHAQAALRALSSNRSDMAGANLLQRQLLPQARAAQKNIAVTTGKPMGGINSLLARPPPAKLLQHVMGGGRGSGMSAARPGSGTAEVAGTGAYGVVVDREGSSGHVAAAAAGSGGSKRSYGVQLLANLQERQGAGDEGTGGPLPKRCKSSTDTWNDGLPMSAPPSISAAKTRAISAALAAGKMKTMLEDPSASARTTPLAATAAAVTAADSATAAARVPRVATRPRFAMPPQLAPHLASLLKPPTAYVGSNSIGVGRSKIPVLPAAVQPTQAERRVNGVGNGGREVRHSGSHSGDSAALHQASGSGSGDSRSSGPGTYDGTEVGLEEHQKGLLFIDLESEEQEADVRGGSTAAIAGVDGDMAEEDDDHDDDRKRRRLATDLVAPVERTCNSDAEIDEKLELESVYNRKTTCTLVTEQQQQRRHWEGYEAEPSLGGRGRSGGRGLAESGGTDGDCEVAVALALNGGGSRSGDVCSLEKLLDVFPRLQDAEEKPSGEVLEAAKDGGGQRSGISGGDDGGGDAAAGKWGKASQRGADSGVVRSGTGTSDAVVTGLLPRVRGLSAPPAARAVEARKQQAAAAKARSEKLKSIGLKVAAGSAAAVVTAQPKPLHAVNMGGSTPFTVNTTEAAVALAVAKGLPMPRARAAATQPAASAAPSSALASAFGSLVQQLPSAAVESRYNELSEEAAGEAVLSMLEGLEARDALVKQLDTITHLKVTAWHCAQCNRLSEFMDKQCRSEGHNLSKATTLKRFWTCNHCNARITTLGMRFPANRCSRCNNPSLEFTACTMYRGPRELKPAGMAAAAGLASKENLFATIEQHPEMGCRTFR